MNKFGREDIETCLNETANQRGMKNAAGNISSEVRHAAITDIANILNSHDTYKGHSR